MVARNPVLVALLSSLVQGVGRGWRVAVNELGYAALLWLVMSQASQSFTFFFCIGHPH